MVVAAEVWLSPRKPVSLMRSRAGKEGWLVQGSKDRTWLPSHFCFGLSSWNNPVTTSAHVTR